MSFVIDDAPGRRRAILVLGMHRSGTSIITRIVSLLGAALPATLMPPTPDNETGYWESSRVNRALEDILKAAGSSWRDWRRFDPAWHLTPAATPYIAALKAAIVSEFGEAPLFVLKDPRICRMVPMFGDVLRELGIEPLALMVIRHPTEVVQSLIKRKLDEIFPQEAGLSWLNHTLDAERDTRTWRRAFIDYAQIREDWKGAVERIGRKLGLQWPRKPEEASEDVAAILDVRHYHNRAEATDYEWAGADWHERVYQLASGYARTGNDLTHSGELDTVTAAIHRAVRPFAGYIASLESALREARSAPPVIASDQAAETPAAPVWADALASWIRLWRSRWSAAPPAIIPPPEAAPSPPRRLQAPPTASDQALEPHATPSWADNIVAWVKLQLQPPRTSAPTSVIPPLKAVFPAVATELGKSPAANGTLGLELRRLIDSYVVCWPFDEEAYLARWPDVKKAVEDGSCASGWHHFRVIGYLEGRLPGAFSVDRDWYLASYRDLAKAADAGRLPDADSHYANHGYREGRLPWRPGVDPDWYAARYRPGGDAAACERDFIERGHLQGAIPLPPR